MDILHKEISKIGDILYFIVSSVEEPYFFYRMKGEIMEMTVTDDHVSYRLKLHEILEDEDTIRGYIVGKHFRMKCIKKKVTPYIDKKIRGTGVSSQQLISYIKNSLSLSWFDVSIMTTFKTEDQMNEAVSKVNMYNIDKLSSKIDYLSKRNIHF